MTVAPSSDRSTPARRLLRGAAFALGAAVLSLVLIGQVIFVVHATTNGNFGSASAVATHGSLAQRLQAAVGAALGSSDRGVRRFHIVAVRPNPTAPRLHDVALTWTINNDLYAGTIGNGAESDVYAILRAIYTSHLPVASVRLTATYPTGGAGHREVAVMRLSMGRGVARQVDAVGWDVLDPQTVWPMVTRSYVAPAFQPLSESG